MHSKSLLIAVALTIAHQAVASAQQPRFDVAQPEHALLERLAGEWQFERQSVPAQGADPQRLGEGTISAEMVGEFFVVARWSGTVYGADYSAVQSLGYDIEAERYSGHWVDSFISYRWALDGNLDEASRELLLNTRGPAPTGGTAAFRERYQFHSDDAITIVGEMQRGDQWVPFSATRLTRLR